MDRSKTILSTSALALSVHFALQLVAGGVLSVAYSPARAYADTAALHVGAWRFVQAFHYWGSAVLIVHAVLHLAALTWAGWYRTNARAYVAAVAMAGLSLAFQATGNLLPGDRHGVQTAAVEGSIAARVPVAGPTLSRLTLGGDEASPRTIAEWYFAHRAALPVVLLVVLVLGWRSVERPKGSRWPLALSGGLALILAFLVASPLGSAAGPQDFTSYAAKPSWYTLPLHGFLVWGGWVGAMLLPALVGLGLLFLPAFKPKPGLVRGLLVAFGIVGLAATFFAGGEAASPVGTRDPASSSKTPVAQTDKAPQDGKLAAQGKTLFDANGCAGCHGADGLKGTGGPSLANVWRVHPDAEYYMRYIKAPQSVEKGSTMPAYPQLKTEELRAMAEFLRYPRKGGD